MQEAPCNARTVRRPVMQNSASNWSGAPHTGTDRRGSCSGSGRENRQICTPAYRGPSGPCRSPASISILSAYFSRPVSLGSKLVLPKLTGEPERRQETSASCLLRCFCQASDAPSSRQAARASSSGASLQITLSQARLAPSSLQRDSQLRIHSPSPQP